jgi:hypothetical protein
MFVSGHPKLGKHIGFLNGSNAYADTNREMVRIITTLLGCLILLHAFSTAPFMVECVGADGRRFIEIVGDDPCRTSHDAMHSLEAQIGDVNSIEKLPDSHNRCSDRFLNNPDYVRQSLRTARCLSMLSGVSEVRGDVVCNKITGNNFQVGTIIHPLRNPSSLLSLNLRV